MGKTAKMLEFCSAGNHERKRLANQESFKKTVLSQVPKERRELLLNESMEADTLLQESVYETIVEGAEPAKCVRDAFPVVNVEDHQMRVTYQSGSTGYAQEVAPGQPIPMQDEDFLTKNIDIKKIGTRPVITNDMIEDELWDMVEWHLKWAGRKLENTFNQDVIKTVLNGHDNSLNETNSSAAFSSMAIARGNVQSNGYNPDKVIYHPDFQAQLFTDETLVYVNRAGSDSAIRNGAIGDVLGLDSYVCGVTAEGSTYGWDYTGSNDIGAIIFDSTAPFLMIGMKRDLTVDQYEDPIHDLHGIAATMRYGSAVISDGAGAGYQYS